MTDPQAIVLHEEPWSILDTDLIATVVYARHCYVFPPVVDRGPGAPPSR